MTRLRCTENTPEVERDIREDLPELDVFFEHGQWWVRLGDLGTWSVNDAEPGPWSFEQVSP